MAANDGLPLTGNAPKSSPLPDLLPTDPLTKNQWDVLLAFSDTLVPCIRPESSALKGIDVSLAPTDYALVVDKVERAAAIQGSNDLVQRYLTEKPSENQAYKDALYRLLSQYAPADLKQQLVLGLTLLDWKATSLILTGRPTRFVDMTIEQREQVIQSWSTNLLPIVRLMFKSLTLMVKQTWAKSSFVLHQVLSYPRVPVHGTPAKSFDFSFLQIPPGDNIEVIETDVVIVGSGCGGGVVAKNLAEAGYKVIVADKGYHYPADHFPMNETEGWVNLFHNGGFLFSEDSSTCVIAGETWGGGGTVNWSASLQTQGFVRQEWANNGLPFFTSSEYQECLDSIFARMGAGTEQIEHNKSNRVLLEGAHKLGLTAKPVPQNTNGKRHYCGYCTMGCGACEKQGPMVSFLPDAASNGATFLEGYNVEKVKFEKNKHTGKQEAIGVIGTWTSRDEYGGTAGTKRSRKVFIKAKKVVISAGTMHTPVILQQSGLKNRHIGKNLKLHPVISVGAIHDEEVRPWEGGILTAVVSSLENLDGQGHGTKLEATTMLPSTWLAFPTWRGGVDWKTLAPRFKNMTGHISLSRDAGSGSVYADPHDGRSRFRYNPIKKDRRHILEGVIALAKINYVSGAREIFVPVPGIPNFVRDEQVTADGVDSGINDPKFNAWLDKVRKHGLPDPDCMFMSAHQMGSCRMGATPAKGAIDSRGKSWEADSLYVADASTFPSASGVNPMVTNMAISTWVARNIIKDLKTGGSAQGKL